MKVKKTKPKEKYRASSWRKITKKTLPAEKKKVFIFANFGNENFNIFTALHEQGVWMIYDMFTKQWRILREQKALTHWRPMIQLPGV